MIIVDYLEDDGRYKPLIASDDAGAVQAAIDLQWQSKGDLDPAHYRILIGATQLTPVLKREVPAAPHFTIGPAE